MREASPTSGSSAGLAAPAALAPPSAVLGEGRLAETIAAAIQADGTQPCGQPAEVVLPPGCPAVVVASDGWDARPYGAVRAACADRAVPWLPVRTELGRAVIGPAEIPGTPGCVACGELRRDLARQHRSGHDAVLRKHGEELASRSSSLLTTLAAGLVAAVVAEELARLAADPAAARTRRAFVYVDLGTLRVTTHPFLPDPLCPHCGDLPADSAHLARTSLRSRPKPAPDTFRVRAVGAELDRLTATYVDAECGLIRSLNKGSDAGLTIASAPMGLRSGKVESGFGRTVSYRASQVTALLEALERYGGMQPGCKRTAVTASYREVRDDAVDPRTLGLHPPDHYQLPGFPFRPFDEAQPCRWVWGHSFARAAPTLVPETYAYYGLRHGDSGDRPFVYEISNGCALGSCLEEAVLYGMLEVAERDAFLMTWYARMPMPRIQLAGARDRTVPLIAQAIEAETGYQVLAFDITLEHGIPCVWAMAVNPDDGDGRPKVACAAGSHLDPERAAANALSELGPALTSLIRRYPAERDRAEELAADPALVTAMPDHALLYASPRVFDRLGFLTGSTRTRGLAEIGRPVPATLDLREDVLHLTDRYLATGMDVILVDQTTPEHQAGGFSCVKVIIPGTLPMTFGHTFRRTHRLPRLHDIPTALGHHAPNGTHPLNPDPHPFP